MYRLLLIYLLVFPLLSSGQTVVPTIRLDTENGLQQNTVTSLAEDSWGRIWLGSVDGVYVYDGYDLQHVEGISSRVIQLIQSPEGLYVFSLNGMYEVNSKNLSIINQAKPPINDYYQAFEIAEGFDLKFINASTRISVNFDLEKISRDTILLQERSHNYDLPLENGQLNSNLNGTYYNSEHEQLLITSSLSPAALKGVHQDAFVASQSGLFHLTESPKLSVEQLFPKERVECLLLDSNDNLWIGTAASGAFMLHRNALTNRFFPNIEGDKQYTSWSMFDHQNNVLCATSNGIMVLNDSSYLLPQTKGLFCLVGISVDPNTILIGTAKEGLFKWSNNQLEQVYFNSENAFDNIIVQLVPYQDHFLACSKHGFIELDQKGNLIQSTSYAENGITPYIMHLKALDSGFLASTTTSVEFLSKELESTRSLTNDSAVVYSMAEDHLDTTWVVSMDGGLFSLLKDALISTSFPDKQLFSIKDVANQLWIESFTAIYSKKGQQVLKYGLQNGFPIKDYSQMGLYADENDYLYTSGIGGVFRFHPDQLSGPKRFPTVLTQYYDQLISDRPLEVGQISQPITLALKPILLSDQNRFEITAEYEEEYFPIVGLTNISFLPKYGDSELTISILNLETKQSIKNTIPIYRDTPLWMKSWFIGLMTLMTILIVIGMISFWKYLKTRRELQKQQISNQLNSERLRISRELHDNIGARLTHIISSLDIEMHQRNKELGTLSGINEFARDTMSQLRETIWAMGDKTIFLSELFSRITQYVDQIISNQLTPIVLKESLNADFELQPTQVINAYRIVQESINNALKYAHASQIDIELISSPSESQVLIKDDGVGFDEKAYQYGSGLANMQSRATEANFELSIQSAPKKGTSVQIIIKHPASK